MRRSRSTFLEEPPAPGAPTTRWDTPVLVVGALAMVVEVLVRSTLPARWLQLALGLAVVAVLHVRRRRPVLATWGTFGMVLVVDVVTWATTDGAGWDLVTGAVSLLAPWTLLRWGSGRQIVLGMVPVLLGAGFSLATDAASLGEAVAGGVFFLLLIESAWLVRTRDVGRRRAVAAVRTEEREHLARELHDTVAHHVSAIIVQAEAGQAVAAAQPERAASLLPAIEQAARQALADMRETVGVLRGDSAAPTEPRPGVHAIAGLRDTSGPSLELRVDGSVDDLPSALDAGVYRLAREAVTNARRHARDASRITVEVVVGPAAVTVEVTDDGRTASGSTFREGFGIEGMRERARLLGGTLEAGPLPTGGWRVHARLPRSVAP